MSSCSLFAQRSVFAMTCLGNGIWAMIPLLIRAASTRELRAKALRLAAGRMAGLPIQRAKRLKDRIDAGAGLQPIHTVRTTIDVYASLRLTLAPMFLSPWVFP